MFGKYLDYKIFNDEIIINFTNKKGIITFINDEIINFHEDKKSDFAVNYHNIKNKIEFNVIYANKLIINTDNFIIHIHDNFLIDIYDKIMNPITLHYEIEESKEVIEENALAKLEGHDNKLISSLKQTLHFTLRDDEYLYGLGEQTGFLNKRNFIYKTWNTDDPKVHYETYECLYKSIPVVLHKNSCHTYGWYFDNSYLMHFDLGRKIKDCLEVSYDKGFFNIFFIYGDNLKKVISNYTLLTGRYPLPQRWALGYHQSRWSYSSKEEVKEIANNFRKLEIPCDVIHLDIDYMENYKVFTYSEDRFPAFKEFIKELNDNGFKIITIIDPGVKVEKGYNIYEEGIKNSYFAFYKGKVYENAVWPGDSVFPNFTSLNVQKWWGDNIKFLTDLGVSGIWNDMNEPASFKGPLPLDCEFKTGKTIYLHEEIHNLYGHLMSKATYNGLKKNTGKRPFVITRACFAGTQKYSTVWTGDNQSIWMHLQMAIPQLINLGLSGFPFCGTDIGGFGHHCSKELMIRWVQLGAFSPLMRNHSAAGTMHQEPWCYDEETINIYRKFVNLRYGLIPYFYDLFYKHTLDGLPIIRPLVLEYPDDVNTFECNTQFMVGEHLLVAPIINQGERQRLVYLPKGLWYDYFTKKEYKSGWHIINAPLDSCPLFVKAGSIIPTIKVNNFISEDEEIIIKVYPGVGNYIHYQDNGLDFEYEKGRYNLYYFIQEGNNIDCKILYEGYNKYKKIIFK